MQQPLCSSEVAGMRVYVYAVRKVELLFYFTKNPSFV